MLERAGGEVGGGRGLDDAALAHDRELAADVGDHGEVVRDEQVGEAAPPAQVDQEVEDLGLDGDVERRGRLVEQDDLRLQDQRPGDRDPLALAAGELVRVAVAEGGAEADLGQRRRDAIARPVQAMDAAGLAQDPVDGVPGVQRAVRVLEHHLQLAP